VATIVTTVGTLIYLRSTLSELQAHLIVGLRGGRGGGGGGGDGGGTVMVSIHSLNSHDWAIYVQVRLSINYKL
jgi:hypothetical protein